MTAPLIVLSEAPVGALRTSSDRDLVASTEAARLAGAQVFGIEPDFSRCEDAEGALWHVPRQEQPTRCWWIGYIPSRERYAAIYEACLARNLILPNSPDAHRAVLELDVSMARLGEVTAPSVVIRSLDEVEAAAAEVGLPAFVKGLVQSRKSRGPEACFADDLEGLRRVCRHLFELDARTRGAVVIRKKLALRHARSTAEGFPMGREYRVFVWDGQILAWGYYWECVDALTALSPEEQRQVLDLAIEAARRVGAPLCGVDIGQDEAGRWWVIETNDPQFSGLSQLPRQALWAEIMRVASPPSARPSGA